MRLWENKYDLMGKRMDFKAYGKLNVILWEKMPSFFDIDSYFLKLPIFFGNFVVEIPLIPMIQTFISNLKSIHENQNWKS